MSLLSPDKSTGHDPAKLAKAIHKAAEPFTLFHNLRAQPMIFALACLGLLGVLVAKALVVRAREKADGSTAGR